MKPSPSYKNPPDSLNPEAEDIWRYTVKKYADSIYESKDLVEQWKVAKNNFERLCHLKGVSPYLHTLEALVHRLHNVVENF